MSVVSASSWLRDGWCALCKARARCLRCLNAKHAVFDDSGERRRSLSPLPVARAMVHDSARTRCGSERPQNGLASRLGVRN